MSTAIVRVVRCDRCGAEAHADSAISLPLTWAQLTEYQGAIKHLCGTCTRRALKVRA